MVEIEEFDVEKIICCPNCKGDLIRFELKYICKNCNCDYRKKEGILILISKELEDELRR